MRFKYFALILVLIGACTLLGGCAVDPMEQLSTDIRSQDVTTKKKAIQQLANLQDPRATEELLGVLERDKDLAGLAAVALVKKGRELKEKQINGDQTNTVVEEVAAIMNNAHLSQQIRARAAWTLGEIGSRQAVTPLLTGTKALVGATPAKLVRQSATQALEKLGYYAEGRPYEIAMGELEGQVDVLKEPEPLTVDEA